MGSWTNYLNPIYDINQLLGASGANVPQQPGIDQNAAKNVNGAQLVYDPQTGMYYDPQSGNTYSKRVNPNNPADISFVPVQNPNVAQQVAGNYNASQSFLNNLSGVQGREQTLEGALTTASRGGPSVGGAQLEQGLGQNAATQLAIASGANGPTSSLATMNAARNTGAANVATNQSAALVRAQEEEAARQQLAQLLTGEANTNLSGAGTFASNAMSGEQAQQGLNQQAATSNQGAIFKLLGAFLKGGAAAGVPGLGATGAAGG